MTRGRVERKTSATFGAQVDNTVVTPAYRKSIQHKIIVHIYLRARAPLNPLMNSFYCAPFTVQ